MYGEESRVGKLPNQNPAHAPVDFKLYGLIVKRDKLSGTPGKTRAPGKTNTIIELTG